MGVPVILYGKSGSGKSCSLKEFGEEEILYVNVENKLLPFRKKFKYAIKFSQLESQAVSINANNPGLPKRVDAIDCLCKQLEKMPCKAAVIDDATYIMSNEFMQKHSAGLRGNAVFELYNNIADSIWKLFQCVKDRLPADVIVYFVLHEEKADDGQVKLLTIGKLLENKVMLEGIVTICLRCMSMDGKHFFRTQTDGTDVTKSPEDMFSSSEIPNDLKAVDTAIRDYYGMAGNDSTAGGENTGKDTAKKEEEKNHDEA